MANPIDYSYMLLDQAESRNKGSHTSKLDKKDLEQIKNILFQENGLYHRIAKIKSSLMNNPKHFVS